MFERHLTTSETLPIPLTGKSLFISLSGTITSINGEVIRTTFDKFGDEVAMLPLWDGYRHYKVAILVALAFKPIHIDVKLWNEVYVLFRDGDRKNLHPSNLVWKWKPGLECPKFPGYAYVPCFTRFVINKEGDLKDQLFGKSRSINRVPSGYYLFTSLRLDIGDLFTPSRHRTLCLAWKDYPVNIDDLHVNHKNGIPGSDHLDNLELITAKENLYHAIRTGLKNGNVIDSVHVRNAKTNDIKVYESLNSCADALDLDISQVHYRCRKLNQAIWPGYLQFQFGHKLKEWRIPSDVEAEHNRSVYSETVLCKNIRTEQVLEFKDASACSRYFGYNDLTISVRLRNKGQKVYFDGCQFQRKCEFKPWRVVTDVEKEIKLAQVSQEVYVRDIFTKQEWEFDSLADAALGLKISNHAIIDRKNSGSLLPWFNFQFKFDKAPWREFNQIELELFKDAIIRNKAFRGRGYVLTDIVSGAKKYYAFAADIAKELDLYRTHIVQSATLRKVLRKKWRIEPYFDL